MIVQQTLYPLSHLSGPQISLGIFHQDPSATFSLVPVPDLAPPGRHHSIVLVFIYTTQPYSKVSHSFPKETIQRENGTFQSPFPIIPFLSSVSPHAMLSETLY